MATTARTTLETYAIVLIGIFTAMALIFGASACVYESFRRMGLVARILSCVFLAWTLATELSYVITMFSTISKGIFPTALAVGMNIPRVPIIVRPILAVWWLFHFLMVTVWSVVLNVSAHDIHFDYVVLVAAVTSGMTYLTYGYVVLCVTTFTRSRKTVERLWHWRGRWSLAHGLVVIGSRLLTNVT